MKIYVPYGSLMKITIHGEISPGGRVFVILSPGPLKGELVRIASEKLLMPAASAALTNHGGKPQDIAMELSAGFPDGTRFYVAGFGSASLLTLELAALALPKRAFLVNPEFDEKMHKVFPGIEVPVTVLYTGDNAAFRPPAQKIHDLTPMSDMVRLPCPSPRIADFSCEPLFSAIRVRLDGY